MYTSYDHLLQEVLIDETALKARIAALGSEISRDYAGVKGLLLLCVLKGGVIFLSDLTRQITVPHAFDFMAASSYREHARESSRGVGIDLDLRPGVEGQDLLL